MQYALGHDGARKNWGLFGLTWIFGISYNEKKEMANVFNLDPDNYEPFVYSQQFLGGQHNDAVCWLRSPSFFLFADFSLDFLGWVTGNDGFRTGEYNETKI